MSYLAEIWGSSLGWILGALISGGAIGIVAWYLMKPPQIDLTDTTIIDAENGGDDGKK